MKTQTKHVYVTFSEYAVDGFSYAMLSESDRVWADKDSSYALVTSVEIPLVKKSDVAALINGQIDEKNKVLRAQIKTNNAKKEPTNA